MSKLGAGLFTIVVVGVLSLSIAPGVFAETRPFQLSLTPDIALYDRDVEIRGVSLGIWNENPEKAFSLGFVNGSSGDSAGFSWGFLANYAESYRGVQWAPVNYTAQDFFGLQHGFVNYAGNFKGVQLGLVNYAKNATGVQIGLINVIRANKWFTELPSGLAPAMVFVNWRF